MRWSITIPLRSNVRAAIEAIPEESWTTIDYTETGAAQAAETLIDSPAEPLRLVVRRTRRVGHQATIWTARRYHAFAADTGLPAAEADPGRAAVTPPPSSPSATSKKAASLTCAVLAYNLTR